MFLNFRIPQSTFYEMDSKYSRLQNFVSESKSGTSSPSMSSHHHQTDPSSSRGIFSRDLFHTNLDRVQNFFNKNAKTNAASSEGPTATPDDMQILLQKGDNDPILPSLSRKQRILGFMICLVMGTVCMSLATLYIPVIMFKARKFALLFSFGSVFFLSSFSMLWGPTNHLKHLTNIERLPFSITYLVTLLGTIYYSVWVKSFAFTLLFAVLQIGALLWYVFSYIPGGARGLTFFSKLFYTVISKSVSTTLSV